jgi:HK97 family phage major capsid protein
MSTDVVKRLQERRLKLVADLRAIAETALDENRELTPEEVGQSEAISAEIDNVGKRIKGFLDEAERAKAQDAKLAEIEGRKVERPAGGGDQTQTGKELRSFLKGETGAPRFYDVKPQGPVNFRDLSKLSAGAGGNTVPTSFYDRLVAHLIETSAMLQLGPTVLNTDSGEAIQVPKTTAHSSAVIVAEAGAIPESDPTFGQITLGAFKYGVMIQVSRELVDDTGVDLEGYLAMQTGRALGNAFGAHLVTGTGTGQPRGVITDAAPGVTGPTGTTVTFGNQGTVGQGFDLLISTFHSVISPYRNSASCGWMMNDTTASLVRRIKSTEGVYAWQPSLVAGAPDTILAKPVVIDPNVASPAANAESIAFGDWSQYFVRLAGGVRFERSDEFAFGNDLVSYRALLRGDGALVDLTGAIKTFQHSAT